MRRFSRNCFGVVLLGSLLFAPTQGWGAGELSGVDFYGIKMKSESFSRGLEFDPTSATPKFLNVDREGFDKNVFAIASLDTAGSIVRGMRVTIYNQTSEIFGVDYLFREFTVVDKNGERYVFGETFALSRVESVGANQNVTFNISFGDASIRKDNIQKIICSFDMGNTKIVLLPLSTRSTAPASVTIAESPVATKPTAAQPAAAQKSVSQVEPKNVPVKETGLEKPKAKPQPAPANKKAGFDMDFWKTNNASQPSASKRPSVSGPQAKESEGAPTFVNTTPPKTSSSPEKNEPAKKGWGIFNFTPKNKAEAAAAPKVAKTEVRLPVKSTPPQPKEKKSASSNIVPKNTTQAPLAKPVSLVDSKKQASAKEAQTNLTKQKEFSAEKKDSKKKPVTAGDFWQKKPSASESKAPTGPVSKTETAQAVPSPKAKPVSKSEPKPAPKLLREPKSSGQVLSVDEKNGFFIADVGEIDGLSANQKLGVFRKGQYVGGAIIRQIRPEALAAVILKEEQLDAIQPGDSVRVV